jgi:hypothetical protein
VSRTENTIWRSEVIVIAIGRPLAILPIHETGDTMRCNGEMGIKIKSG